jgi:hypothetical protein
MGMMNTIEIILLTRKVGIAFTLKTPISVSDKAILTVHHAHDVTTTGWLSTACWKGRLYGISASFSQIKDAVKQPLNRGKNHFNDE